MNNLIWEDTNDLKYNETVYFQAPHEYFSPAFGRILVYFRERKLIDARWGRGRPSLSLSMPDRRVKRFPSLYRCPMGPRAAFPVSIDAR